MKIPKYQALELLNEKIATFEGILNKVSEESLYDESYKAIVAETETLLAKLFSYDEVLNFRKYTTSTVFSRGSELKKEKEETYLYKEHIKRCIGKLKVCMENFYDFPAESGIDFSDEEFPSLFLSPSCQSRCNEIQMHLLEILKTLQVSYFTTQPYQNLADHPEVEKVISETDIFICIIGKNELSRNNNVDSMDDLKKELEWAKKLNKKVIAWLEDGVNDFNGLIKNADIVNFKVGDISSLRQATINFLEVLKRLSVI
jgi:hypothetical protein